MEKSDFELKQVKNEKKTISMMNMHTHNGPSSATLIVENSCDKIVYVARFFFFLSCILPFFMGEIVFYFQSSRKNVREKNEVDEMKNHVIKSSTTKHAMRRRNTKPFELSPSRTRWLSFNRESKKSDALN